MIIMDAVTTVYLSSSTSSLWGNTSDYDDMLVFAVC